MSSRDIKPFLAVIIFVMAGGLFIFFANIQACNNAGGHMAYNWLSGTLACVNSDNVIIIP